MSLGYTRQDIEKAFKFGERLSGFVSSIDSATGVYGWTLRKAEIDEEQRAIMMSGLDWIKQEYTKCVAEIDQHYNGMGSVERYKPLLEEALKRLEDCVSQITGS